MLDIFLFIKPLCDSYSIVHSRNKHKAPERYRLSVAFWMILLHYYGFFFNVVVNIVFALRVMNSSGYSYFGTVVGA